MQRIVFQRTMRRAENSADVEKVWSRGRECGIIPHPECGTALFDAVEMQFVVEPGQLDIMVGTSSEDLPLKDTVTLTGKKNNVAGRRSYTCQVEEA